MKGMVFTEFIEFVEEKYGFDVVDMMIEKSKVPNDGAYTQAGNYPFEEIIDLVVALSEIEQTDLNMLIQTYGEYLFGRLAALYPNIKQFESAFEIISHVDDFIHPEVQKLYPDADLPEFETIEKSDDKIVLRYKSKKGLHQLAKGLILGAGAFYKENLSVVVDDTKNPVEIEVRQI